MAVHYARVALCAAWTSAVFSHALPLRVLPEHWHARWLLAQGWSASKVVELGSGSI